MKAINGNEMLAMMMFAAAAAEAGGEPRNYQPRLASEEAVNARIEPPVNFSGSNRAERRLAKRLKGKAASYEP